MRSILNIGDIEGIVSCVLNLNGDDPTKAEYLMRAQLDCIVALSCAPTPLLISPIDLLRKIRSISSSSSRSQLDETLFMLEKVRKTAADN